MGMHAHGTCCPQPLAQRDMAQGPGGNGAPMGPWGAANKRLAPNKARKACKVGCKPKWIAPTGHPTALWAVCKAAPKAVCKAASYKASCAATRQGHWGVAPAPSWPMRPGGRVPKTTNCEVQGHQQRMPRVALCCMIVQHFFGWAQCWGLPTSVLGQHMHTVAGSVAVRLLVLTVHCWGPRCHRWWQLILCMIETFGF